MTLAKENNSPQKGHGNPLKDTLQLAGDRMFLFPSLEYTLSSVDAWKSALDKVLDQGVIPFVESSHERFGMKVWEFAAKTEHSLGVGAARVVRDASLNDLHGDIGERVGDALIASLELSVAQGYSRPVNMDDTRVKISSVITQNTDYADYDRSAHDELAEKSIVVWQNVLSAVDRKAKKEGTGETVNLFNRVVNVRDLKAFITADVLVKLAADGHQRPDRADAVNAIEVWRRKLEGKGSRFDFYNGVLIMSSVFRGEKPTDADFVPPSLQLNPPSYFAQPFLEVARELNHYRNMKSIGILNGLVAGVVGYHYLLNQPLDHIEDTIKQEAGFDVGHDYYLNRAFIDPLRSYIQELEDENTWSKISETEAFGLMYLGRTLNPNIQGEDELFEQLVNFGLDHEHPSVRLMALRTLIHGEALVEGQTYDLADNYTEMIREKLFGRQSSETKQIWQEVMERSSMEKSAQWLLEALYDDNKMRRVGETAFSAFVEEHAMATHGFLMTGEKHMQNTVKELIDAVESRWHQLNKSNHDALGVLDSYTALSRAQGLLKDK
ncbi:MAG TPA: hypothetical protein VMR81_04850 [Patescibacteria group bacterium]|nr:hypothetical protein [Patescibacteria group bacterium]